MIAPRLPVPRFAHAASAVALVFAALAIWPWIVPPVPEGRALAPPAAAKTAPAVVPLPPLASYAAMVERPLFAPSRRPAPGAATPGSSVESRYRLLGIVVTGSRKKALVADGARRVEIGEGDTLDGRPVKEIGRDSVRLSSPAGDIVLRLNRKDQ